MWLAGILTLCVVSETVGQCCTPDQWEATEDVFTGQKKGNDLIVSRGMRRVSYDAKKKRMAISGIDYTKNIATSVIQEFSQGKEYVWSKGVCQIIQIGAFNQSCVPLGATHLGKTFVGRYPDTIPVDMYSFRDPRFKGSTTYSTVGQNCTPVEAHLAGTYPNGEGGYTEFTVFSNFTVGIIDESVFTPPEFCKSQTVKPGFGRKRRGVPYF